MTVRRRMPDKMQMFCEYVAMGKSLIEAYRLSGYGTGDAKPASERRYATRLRARPDIDRRIKELQAAALRVTRESMTAEVNAAMLVAAENHTAKATMLTLKARLHGLVTENVSVSNATNYPLDKLLADCIAAGIPEAVARRKLGMVSEPTAEVIPLKR
jgi:hypothetical protein